MPWSLIKKDKNRLNLLLCPLKVSQYRKQNTKISHAPKNQQFFLHFFALASKKWLKQKIKELDDLN
jgi:hypothetical protein